MRFSLSRRPTKRSADYGQIRVTRIAVVSAGILRGAIGKIDEERLARIRTRVANWILGTSGTPDDEKWER